MIDPTAIVHSLALVDPSASIGPRTRIWQFASVIRGAVLGADCTVANCVTVDASVFGDRCIVGHSAAIAPGFKFGDDVFIGPNVTICNDGWPTVSKDGFDLDGLRSGRWTVIVEDHCSIGAGAVVLPGIHIGWGSMIAAGAVVDRNVPAGHLFKRNGKLVPIDGRAPRRMREATKGE